MYQCPIQNATLGAERKEEERSGLHLDGQTFLRLSWLHTHAHLSCSCCHPVNLHQGNFDGKIIHYNHQKGVDKSHIYHYQPPFGDYNGLSFHQNFPDVDLKSR